MKGDQSQFVVRVTPSQLAKLDGYGLHLGISRNKAVARLIDEIPDDKVRAGVAPGGGGGAPDEATLLMEFTEEQHSRIEAAAARRGLPLEATITALIGEGLRAEVVAAAAPPPFKKVAGLGGRQKSAPKVAPAKSGRFLGWDAVTGEKTYG